MNLPRFSVRNPVAVNLMMWAVLIGGLIAWISMVREFFPRMEAEQVLITVPYPGATPEEIERSVTRLVEREIENIGDVEEIQAKVFEGVSIITVEMEQNADRDRVLNDIRGELDKVIPNLPDGAEEPEIIEARPNIPVIAVVLSGEVPEHQLHDAVLKVEDDLLDIDSVTELVVTGFRKREITVEILPEKLDEYGVTFEQVGRAVAALNRDIPGGQLKGAKSNVRVRTMGEERVPHEIEKKIILTAPDGTSIRLGDVARVQGAFEDKTEKGRFQGKTAAQIFVFKTPEQDAIEIAEAVKAYVKENPTMVGGAVKLETTTDLSRFIAGRLDLMVRNARTGLILLLITLAIFLELRVAFWVAIGLAVAFMGTFVVMWTFGLSINLISLFGLIVVLGLIVDDAIVIGENIFRKQRDGMPHLAAAEDGANKVALPVIAAVLTTCAAFAPLAFIEGRMGKFLGVLPQVVVAALFVSLFEGFLILPGHLAHKRKPWFSGKFARGMAVLGRFGERRHRFFEKTLPGILEKQLRFMLRWRYATAGLALMMLPVVAGLVAGGVVPFVFLPDTDAETLTADLEMAAGTPEIETQRALDRVAEIARSKPEIQSTFAVIGASFGERGRQAASDPAVVGQVTIEMVPADERELQDLRKSQEVLTELRRESADLPGVRRLSFASRSGGPGGPDIEMRVRGDDLDTLQKALVHVREHIASYAGIEEMYDDFELGKLEARMRLREDARLLGLTTQEVALQLRHALYGFEVQDLQIGEDEVTVRVLLPESERRTLEDLGRLRIGLPSGARVPLSEAATFEMDRGYASLMRVDGRRTATIFAQVDDSKANAAQIVDSIGKAMNDIDRQFPGVSVSFEGRRKETRESMGSLKYLFPIALLLIYAIIAVLFRSYVQPVIVMSIIPFAIVGAVLGHLIMGFPLTLLSLIGLVALAGIVVNDGLILVDLANRKRREGLALLDAVVEASKGRMRAILLTSITTCVGLAPIMLETSFQAQFLIPMAISIVFGLAFATFLILALLPVFYLCLEDVRAGIRWLFGSRWHQDLGYDPGIEVGKKVT